MNLEYLIISAGNVDKKIDFRRIIPELHAQLEHQNCNVRENVRRLKKKILLGRKERDEWRSESRMN